MPYWSNPLYVHLHVFLLALHASAALWLDCSGLEDINS